MTVEAQDLNAATGSMRQVHVGRQPIYDAQLQVIGYELLFRARREAETATQWGDLATSTVIVNTFTEFGLDRLVDNRLGFINVTRPFLVGDLPVPFRPESAVLEILETGQPDDELVDGVRRLVDEGFAIALDGPVWERANLDLAQLVSYVKADTLGADPGVLRATAQRCREFDLKLVAERIEDAASFELARELGFDLFQGYHLARPQVVSAPALSPTQAGRIQLLGKLSRPDLDLDDVMDVVRIDPALSYRTLHAANAASSGLSRPVSSVREAMVLLGLNRLRSWLVLMVIADASQATDEQLSATMTRARACELLAADVCQGSPADEEAAFTVGLLSGVADLLGTPIAELLQRIQLDEAPQDALLGGDGPLGRVLAAVRAQETDDFAALSGAGLPVFDVSRAYLSAVGWSLQICRSVLAA
jgi:EAL and modified HD-GYP domain-containing signal transduction protein